MSVTNSSTPYNPACGAILEGVLSGRGKLTNGEFTAAVDELRPAIDNLTETRLAEYKRMAQTREQMEYAKRMTYRTRVLQDMFDLVTLRPGESNALFNFASLGLDWTIGKVGRVKKALDFQRETAASVLEYMTRTSVTRANNELNKAILDELPGIGLMERRTLGVHLVEMGGLDAELVALSSTPLSIIFNNTRVDRFKNWAMTEYGLTLEQLDRLIQRGVQVSAAEDEIRILAQSLGLSVEKLNDLGYLHRGYTKVGKARLRDIRGVAIGQELDRIGIGTHPLASLSRQFNFIQPTTVDALTLFIELSGLSKGRLYETFAQVGTNYQWLQGRATDVTNAVQVARGNVLELVVGNTAKDPDRITTLFRKLKAYTAPKSAERKALVAAFKARDEKLLSDMSQSILSPRGYDAVAFSDKRTGDAFILNWSADFEKFDATGDLFKMMDDPYAFTEFVRNTLTSDQLDNLVDSNMLQLLPMSSGEILELLNGKYNMGFDNLAQLMEVDLLTASQQYAESMKNAFKQGAVMQTLIDGRAEAAGWVIPASSPDLKLPMYSDYVTIGDKFNEHFIKLTGAPPTTSLADTLTALGYDGKTAADLASSKMHPVVAATFNQYIATAWNPSILGQAGEVISHLSSDALRYGVASGGLGYINRNLLETYYAASMFGFNPGRIKEARDIINGLARTNDLSLVDNRPWAYFEGREISKREAVQMFMEHFSAMSASDMPNIQNGFIEGGMANFMYKVGDFPTHIKKWYEYANADPSKLGVAERSVYDQFKRYVEAGYGATTSVLDDAWVRTVSMAHWGEMYIKLGFWMSQFEPIGTAGKTANWVGYAATGGYYRYSNTVEQLSSRMMDAFINPNTMGWVPRLGNTWFGSFLQYAIKSPYVFAKAAIANPVKVYNWHRVHSLWNQIHQEKHDQIRAGFAPWELKENPHYMGMVEDKYGRPMNILLYPQGYDSFSKTWTAFGKAGGAIHRAITGNPGNANEKLEDIKGEGPFSPEELARTIALNSGQLQQAVLEQLLGKDILTNIPFKSDETSKRSSFLFFSISDRTRSVIERLIPALAYMDNVNLFDAFGSPELRDANGQILQEGTPAWITGNERYPARALDKIKSSDGSARFLVTAFRLAGLNVRLSSVEDNVANNLSDISYTLDEVTGKFNKSLRDLQFESASRVIDEEEWARRDEATSEMLASIFWLQHEEIRLTMLAGEYGIIPKDLQDNMYHATVTSFTTHRGLPPQVHNELTKLYQDTSDKWNMYQELRNASKGTATEE